MKRKWIAMTFLAVSLLLLSAALAGCTASNNEVDGEGGENKPANETDETNEGDEEEASEGMPEKFDPAVELTTVSANGPSVTLPEGDEMNDNAWTRHLEEDFGIKVETLWNAPGEQYE